MTELVFYHFPRACSGVTMTAMEEAGLDYEDRVVDIFKGEQHTPEYRAIHPGGKVPALWIDGKVLTENAAIIMYLDSAYPEAGFLPSLDNPFDKAKTYADLVWCSGTIHPITRQIRMPVRYTDEATEGVHKKGMDYMHGIMQQIEKRVQGGQWWYGERWSIVDVYLNWCFSVAENGGFPVSDYPAVDDLRARVNTIESYKRAKAREQAAIERSDIEFPPVKGN